MVKTKEKKERKLITAAVAAKLIGLQKRTIHDHVTSGRLKVAQKSLMGVDGKRCMFLFDEQDVIKLGAELRPNGVPGRGRPRVSDTSKKRRAAERN